MIVGAAAVAVATGGLVVFTAGASGAGAPTITAGSGSSLSCNVTGSGKLNPGLKNDWVQADHSSDPVAAVAAIPNTTFGSPGPVEVTVKGTGTCTGTVVDATNPSLTATGTDSNPIALKFSLANDPSNPGNNNEATCQALVTGNPPSTAEYNITISYKFPTAKITPTTVTDAVIPPSSFNVQGGTVSGSFAGGSASASGVPDNTTVNAVLQSAPTSSNPTPAYPQCQPTLKIKTSGKGVTTASLKPPKGLKALQLVSGSTLSLSDNPPS